ncbi:MAG: hemolysin family protein [Flavobacteriales bacterium]|nr:hemolysin family protein [Flavobacteriales bacterium]MDG1779638.1 hemolysin family protein [Flavobacteriales bacterium]MDG2245545.1 hemolysin family protein [Flavobacteriales bacterium]
MPYDSWLIILISLLFSAFFSGMEIAFVSANKLKIELDNKQGLWTAKILAIFIGRPKVFIATMLIGNNLALVFYGIESGELLANLLFHVNDWSEASSPYLALGTQTLISTIVILITAEFLPKSIFRINPNTWLSIMSIPLLLIFYLLFIPSWLVTQMSKGFLRVFLKANTSNEKAVFGVVDLDHYLKEVTENMNPDQDLEHEIQILQNALDFSHLKARDCLIPRNELVALNVEDEVSELTSLFIETGLSKIVIYRDTIDNVIGYVHVRDVFKQPETISKVLMPVFIVPEPMAANEVLELFIKKKGNLAVVVDEFGGTSGIMTIEDIVEEIFGEIEDEHDKEDFIEQQINEHHYQFSARLEIDYLNEEYDLQLPESDEYDTLGGMIVFHTEDIPEQNDVIIVDNYTCRVLKVSQTKIEVVDLRETEGN